MYPLETVTIRAITFKVSCSNSHVCIICLPVRFLSKSTDIDRKHFCLVNINRSKMQLRLWWTERVVLFQSQRQEVPDRNTDKQSHCCRILEGDGSGQGSAFEEQTYRDEKNPSFLQGKSTKRKQNGLDYARISASNIWKWAHSGKLFSIYFLLENKNNDKRATPSYNILESSF